MKQRIKLYMVFINIYIYRVSILLLENKANCINDCYITNNEIAYAYKTVALFFYRRRYCNLIAANRIFAWLSKVES